jgi:hypothetical protein
VESERSGPCLGPGLLAVLTAFACLGPGLLALLATLPSPPALLVGVPLGGVVLALPLVLPVSVMRRRLATSLTGE